MACPEKKKKDRKIDLQRIPPMIYKEINATQTRKISLQCFILDQIILKIISPLSFELYK